MLRPRRQVTETLERIQQIWESRDQEIDVTVLLLTVITTIFPVDYMTY